MSEGPNLKVGSVLKDSGDNVWIVRQVNTEPTYEIVQVWAGTSKSNFYKKDFENTKFGSWSELTKNSNGITVLKEEK